MPEMPTKGEGDIQTKTQGNSYSMCKKTKKMRRRMTNESDKQEREATSQNPMIQEDPDKKTL
jgi:hypothetical protein